jgi:VanZ family protein
MRSILAYLPAAVWAGVLLWVGGQTDLSPPRLPIPMQDKVMHFLAYGILGALAAWGRALAGWWPTRAWPLLLVLSGIGAVDEAHQATIPEREAEIGDWVADTLGAFTFFAAVSWRLRRRSWRR